MNRWSSVQGPNPITAHTFVDDIEVEALCNPFDGITPLTAVAEIFQFTEGPLWRNDHLLFSDIDADTIYRLDPPTDISVFRNLSDGANGLALDSTGRLLAAEHLTRRVSVTSGAGVVSTLVGDYLGDTFNSPNDLAVRSDGVIYFTDPDYGLVGPPDIPFHGLFRWHPTLGLIAEWEGNPATNQPNGVILSPDEATLYLADSTQGTITRWDVGTDGALSNPQAFASGLTIPDGLCLDQEGNLWVATWASTLEVFAPDGTPWGALTVPQQATNCTFGGADRRTLYVTAQSGLYETSVAIPGE